VLAIHGLVLAVSGAVPRALRAQGCEPPAYPYFEFQVTERAQFVPDSTVSPHPSARSVPDARAEPALVQFVVDSLGVPEQRTYKFVAGRDPELAADGRRVVMQWRFRPARVGNCRVPQLVQVLLER
jgi:hypothetical protein